jgi:sugar phosphate isomerase/epimerase
MTTFALSTRWNASQHTAGEKLVEEILQLGFAHIELGYDLRADLVPGVRKMVEQGAVKVDTVHNFCPVPVGAPYGHPELFLLASTDRRARSSAVLHTANTVQFAAAIGAGTVVVHAGRVDMRNLTGRLLTLCEQGRQFDARYEKVRTKLLLKREKKARPHIDSLCAAIDELMPVLQRNNVRLAVENLPSWEAVPSEAEMDELLTRYNSPLIGYWHDVGHGQVRQHLGFVNALYWLEKLSRGLAGMHLHDVTPPAYDHIMPPHGKVDFAPFGKYAREGVALVFEPAPGTPGEQVRDAAALVGNIWAQAAAAAESAVKPL